MGWNGSDRAKFEVVDRGDASSAQTNRKSRFSLRQFIWLLVLLAVVGTGVQAYLLLRSDVNKPCAEVDGPGRAKSSANDCAVFKDIQKQSAKQRETTNAVAMAENASTSLPTNDRVRAVHNEESVIILADGSRFVPKKPIFHKPVERLLNRALIPVSPGSAPGAMSFANRYTDEQLLKMMKEKVVIKPTDDERMVNAKLDVQELKDRVLAHVADGGDVRDIFREIDQRAVEESKERHLSDVGLRMVRKMGDPELAKAWVEKRNKKLEELGMPKIRVPAALDTSIKPE